MSFNNHRPQFGPGAALIVVVTLGVVLILSTALSVQAQTAAPNNLYLVTSSADTAIKTCAGGVNDCSLRGAVELANASPGNDTINFSPSVSAVTLNQPITVTGGNILINGNGSEAITTLYTNGNFAALVLNSDGNTIRNLWITSNGSHKGTAQHGLIINGDSNTIDHNSVAGLGGNGLYITGRLNVITATLIGVQTLGGSQWANCFYANDQSGIDLTDADNNTISRNTIGCSGQNGIIFHGNSYNNAIEDNYIGVTNMGGRVPNGLAGVLIWSGRVNEIGNPGHGNVIGANLYGVLLAFGNTHDNNVQYNSIGVSGTLNISNTIDGVNLQQGSTGNWIEHNDIGYNAVSGVAIVGNSPTNTVYYNTIHHQGQNGVWIGDSDGNDVDVNFIGVHMNGNQALAGCAYANGTWGVRLDNATNSSINSNIIGCSGYDGVGLAGASTYNNEVYNNWIGVASNGARVPNVQAGVAAWGGAHGNLIGRSDYGNVIGANGSYGVYLGDPTTANNWVQLNSIGISGTQNFSNTLDGVAIVGGAHNTQLVKNQIANNGHNGVWINSATTYANTLLANVILRNQMSGVAIQGSAHDNVLGQAVYGNIIGGNSKYGVLIEGSGLMTNTVQLNSIGISGTTNISNTRDGVAIIGGARANRVYTNTIAYNDHNGVWIDGAGTDYNQVQANIIRLNKMSGVAIQGGASANYIGRFGNRSAGNLISANTWQGIYIADSTTASNGVFGNRIGTNSSGNAADPNGLNGVLLDLGTHDNAIGALSTERNVIAGNTWAGVSIQNGAHDNWVQFNDIGTNRDYAAVSAASPNLPTGGSQKYIALPNAGDGIALGNAYTNTIGGYISNFEATNFINNNSRSGIYVTAGSHHNTIGLNDIRDNVFYGVLLEGNNTAYNTLTRTQVFSNGLDGIGERNNATLNVWTEVGIHDNGGLGIDKQASDDGQNIVNAPNLVIDSINQATGVVQGHTDAIVVGSAKVELYRVSPNASGYGEGAIFVGKTTADVNGNWTITDTSPAAVRGCYTAFVTEAVFVIPFFSSEFSANTCRVMLPLTRR